MKNARTIAITVPSLLIAGVCAVLAIAVYAPFTYAEETTSSSASSTVTVAPEKLEKDLKKFADKEGNLRDTRTVGEKIKLVERRIAELKKHIERYEGLLQRLKAADGSEGAARKGDEKRKEVKDKWKEKASSTRAIKGDVLGASTTAAVVPVVPVCRISFDKRVYVAGEVMVVSWKSTGAAFANFVLDESGKDTLPLPGDRLGANGSQSVNVTVSGNPQVTIKVTSETGHTSVCGRIVPVLAAGATVNDRRIAPLTAQLIQVQNQIEKLMVSRAKIDENIIKLSTNLGIIQSKIAVALELGSGPVTPTSSAAATQRVRISTSADNPDASQIVVSSSGPTNDVTILGFSADGGSKLQQLTVNLTTQGKRVDAVVGAVKVVIGDKTYSPTSWKGANTPNAQAIFTLDGAVATALAGQVKVDVKPFGSQTYLSGQTIVARVVAAHVKAVDAVTGAPITKLEGSVVGGTHILMGPGPAVPADGFSSTFTTSGENDTVGTFVLNFEVTAVETDIYIPKTTALTVSNKQVGVNYRIEGPAGRVPANEKISASLTSSADEKTAGIFTVAEGTTETFTLTVTLDPSVTGLYRVQLLQLNWTDNAGGVPNQTRPFLPYAEFKTEFENINSQ